MIDFVVRFLAYTYWYLVLLLFGIFAGLIVLGVSLKKLKGKKYD
jgi:hypothetical protein